MRSSSAQSISAIILAFRSSPKVSSRGAFRIASGDWVVTSRRDFSWPGRVPLLRLCVGLNNGGKKRLRGPDGDPRIVKADFGRLVGGRFRDLLELAPDAMGIGNQAGEGVLVD